MIRVLAAKGVQSTTSTEHPRSPSHDPQTSYLEMVERAFADNPTNKKSRRDEEIHPITFNDNNSQTMSADISNRSLLAELQYKNEDIGRLKREIVSLKKTVQEQAEMVKTLVNQLNQQSDDTKLGQMLEVAKQIIDRYQKGQFKDSTVYPSEGDIMRIIVARFGCSDVQSLCNADRLELSFHIRERRNRLSPKIRKCFMAFNNDEANEKLALTKKDMDSSTWHFSEGIPFNHPAVVYAGTSIFVGKNRGWLTMSQLCFTAAVIKLMVQEVNLTATGNIDKLQDLHDDLKTEFLDFVGRARIAKTLIEDEESFKLGSIVIADGFKSVADSLSDDPITVKSKVK